MKKQWHGGKGSQPRGIYSDEARERLERIFNKDQDEKHFITLSGKSSADSSPPQDLTEEV